MGWLDNRRTPKMRRRKRRAKLKNRIKRRIAEASSARTKAAPAPTGKKKK